MGEASLAAVIDPQQQEEQHVSTSPRGAHDGRAGRVVRTSAVVGAAALVLGGCGGLRPGTAAEVGEERITTAEVDQVAGQFCDALREQLDSQAQTIPHSFLRGGIAATLAMREVAEQVADDYGVEPDSPEYVQQMRDLRRNVASLPEEQEQAVIQVESAPFYVEEVQAAVGEELRDGEGDRDDFIAAGDEEMQRWISEHGVEFNPSLNTTVQDGRITTSDQSLSFAVSEEAKAGMEEQPNAMLARQLPESHRCGR